MNAILIVEDEAVLGRTIRASLMDDGHVVHWVPSAEEASAWLDGHLVDLALVDIQLPGRDGMGLLKEVARNQPDAAVIMMTARNDVPTAVEAMKLGAIDFLIKPVDLDALSLITEKTLTQRRLCRHWNHEHDRQRNEFGLSRIVGTCSAIEDAKRVVARVGRVSPVGGAAPNVLITGETGTGKDLFARAIHFEGPRRAAPFVHINCASIPENLAESELFGHVKGAFTDARTTKQGLFELADQGTLFLDEVCSLPVGLQAKLLSALELRRIRPVGGTEEKAIDVHLVTAMNRDPERLIARGALRADLYHRLRVVHLQLPPLRERGDDLITLAEHLVAEHCHRFQIAPKRLAPSAIRAIKRYHWPGNVRELAHCLETAVMLSDDAIEGSAMPLQAASNSEDLVRRNGNGPSIPLDFSLGPISMEDVERQMITHALTAAKYNVTRAAELLAISRDTLRYRLDKHGIDVKNIVAKSKC